MKNKPFIIVLLSVSLLLVQFLEYYEEDEMRHGLATAKDARLAGSAGRDAFTHIAMWIKEGMHTQTHTRTNVKCVLNKCK